MNYIKKNLLENQLFYNGEMVLKYHIEYPSINGNSKEIVKFNSYNRNLALELKNKSENELYNEAVETYKFNKENGYPIMVYEVYRNFEVTFNANNIISLYFDEYVFQGGAHGNTVRTSQTWDLLRGCMLKLEDFFKNKPYFVVDILKKINEQIAENSEIYFENSCVLVLDTFNPKNFYLTGNAISMYFQQYDIAPYSSGIRVFIVKEF